MSSVIEIQNISKVYRRNVVDFEYGKLKLRFRERLVHALKDLSFEVEEGEVFGLLGPNGAGKSTLIKTLMTIHYPTSGSALIYGKPYWDINIKKKIGFLPENPYFYDYLTGEEFLEFYGKLYEMPEDKIEERIPEVLKMVGLDGYDIEKLPLKGYSKGMIQRIGVAQAVLSDPSLVILDEPLSGLDPLGRKELRDVILKLKEQGKTIFFSSHILQDVETICDRVAILYKGELLNVGKMTDLLSTEITGYEVQLKTNNSSLIKVLEEKAQRALVHEDELFLFFSPETDIKGILRQVEQEDKDAQLISVAPRRETLEDYFIRKIKMGE